MVLIFVGALFTVLNFWIEFPSGAILQFFPDFVGYILIHIGVNRMLEREDYLSYQMYNSVIALRFLLGISALSWLADLFFSWTESGVPVTMPAMLVAIVQIVLSTMFWLSFVGALEEVEKKYSVDLVTDYLKLAVILWKGAEALTLILTLTGPESIQTFALVVAVGAVILFIIELFRAMRRYQYLYGRRPPH